jgi:hypothetical protein
VNLAVDIDTEKRPTDGNSAVRPISGSLLRRLIVPEKFLAADTERNNARTVEIDQTLRPRRLQCDGFGNGRAHMKHGGEKYQQIFQYHIGIIISNLSGKTSPMRIAAYQQTDRLRPAAAAGLDLI